MNSANSTEITLNPARPSDAGWIAEMSCRLIEAGLPWSWTPRRVAEHIRHPASVVLTARSGRDPVGFAIMSFADQTAHLNLLAVEPGTRRAGIGRRLVTWLEESALVAGTFVIGVEVRASNSRARGFYRRLGYREVCRMPRYYSGIEDAIRLSYDVRATSRDNH